MTYIPSEKVAEGFALGRTGLWVEALGDGRIALIAKIPESVIKALYRGARSSFFLGVMRGDWMRILCLGLRVNDEPENPFTVTMANSSPQDAVLLKQILRGGSTTLHCVDELNHPVLSAWCTLDESCQRAAPWFETSDHWLLTLDSSREIPVMELARNLDLALDRFQGPIYRAPGPGDDPVFEIGLSLELWPRQTVIDVSPTLEETFRIDDEDEGTKLERAIHTVMDAVYPGRSYRSPQIRTGKGRRELADVIGFDEQWLCVVQAKALSVLGVDAGRSSQRRASTVTKDITGAFKQLSGAMRKLRARTRVDELDGAIIAIPDQENIPAHAIVVLSEMYSFVDWKAVAAAAIEASEKGHRTLFHVFDIQELSHIAATAASAETFNAFLVQRWAWVKLKGTAYGRSRPRREGDPPPEEWFSS
jgi:hypothetical protein